SVRLWLMCAVFLFFFFSSRRRHTRLVSDWSSDVCSSDLPPAHGPDRALVVFGFAVAILSGAGLDEIERRSSGWLPAVGALALVVAGALAAGRGAGAWPAGGYCAPAAARPRAAGATPGAPAPARPGAALPRVAR